MCWLLGGGAPTLLAPRVWRTRAAGAAGRSSAGSHAFARGCSGPEGLALKALGEGPGQQRPIPLISLAPGELGAHSALGATVWAAGRRAASDGHPARPVGRAPRGSPSITKVSGRRAQGDLRMRATRLGCGPPREPARRRRREVTRPLMLSRWGVGQGGSATLRAHHCAGWAGDGRGVACVRGCVGGCHA